jgi:hypothetical protein
VRSRSSVRSSAASEQSFSGSRHNPFKRQQGSVCSSRTSRAPSETSSAQSSLTQSKSAYGGSTVSCKSRVSHESSQTSRALSARNLKNHDKVKFKFAPAARSCSSATTSASAWSQMSSENASSLYSR